jgi:hypothetical protein
VIEILLQAERALEMGRIDAAETLYRQVAEADPRNSIAVVGLARVTLERGDELGAYLQARRALAIDPENAAAGRMVQRLEEVMRYRGDPVAEPYVRPAAQPAAPAVRPAPGPVLEPEPGPAPSDAPEPGPRPQPAPAPGAAPTPKAKPVAPRSFLRRILDRFRRG